jgi:hypothetical protein
MENHPKIYVALDKKIVCELADNAKAEMNQVDLGNTNEKRIKNETIVEMVQWILDNDIYTKPWEEEEDRVF